MVSVAPKRLVFGVMFIVFMSITAVVVWDNTLVMYASERWVGFENQRCQFGNQLWLLASTYGIAKARKAKWCVIDGGGIGKYYSYLEWTENAPERCPESVLFQYTSQLVSVGDGGKFAGYSSNYLNSRSPSIRADGCLQSFKYFDKVNPIPFRLRSAPGARVWVRERAITTAIHIRRGDKMGDHLNIVPPVSYFEMAVDLLKQLVPGDGHIFVLVTDAPAWVHGIPFFSGMYVLSSDDPSFDMAVISECQHKILSIGTFGWWGAFLNDNSTSVVIYPALQFVAAESAGFYGSDYFPAHWIGIDYSTV
jgi:hypothetical protein